MIILKSIPKYINGSAFINPYKMKIQNKTRLVIGGIDSFNDTDETLDFRSLIYNSNK